MVNNLREVSGRGVVIERDRRTVCLPYHVDEYGTRKIYTLDSHALDVVQFCCQTPEVTAEAQLGLSPVPFEGRVEELVIGRIAICKLVHENGVKGNCTPVRGRWGVCCVGPGGVVVRGGLG